MNKLPNLIIAGVNKAGTSSLFTYLSKHPDICGSSIKETCYFLPTRYNEKMENIEVYEQYFHKCQGSKYILEATPGYFYGGGKTAKYIKSTLDSNNVKIILILRNPIERTYSFFNHTKAKLWLDESVCFDDCIKNFDKKNTSPSINEYSQRAILESMYDLFLEDWLKVFDKNIKIVYFEDLKNNPKTLMDNLVNWLDVDNRYFKDFNFEIENKTVKPKNKLLHTLVLKTYGKLEIYLRKHTSLKNKIRDIYYKINSSSYEKNTNNFELKNLLSESYIMQRNILLKYNQSLPEWLKDIK